MPTRWPFVLLFWGQILSSSAQTYAPASFRETLPPQIGSAAWSKLNYAPGYAAKNVAGVLVLEKSSQGNSCALRIPEGTFLGQDQGEWGGQLLFQPTAKGTKPVLLKKGNVRFLFQTTGHVYFLEGLAHMNLNRGALYELTGKAPAFTWVKRMDLEGAPEAFAVVGRDVYIAQFDGFTILRNLREEVTLQHTFWYSLYPNSIAVFKKDEVCIGMRGGYVRLNTRTKAMRFFQYGP